MQYYYHSTGDVLLHDVHIQELGAAYALHNNSVDDQRIGGVLDVHSPESHNNLPSLLHVYFEIVVSTSHGQMAQLVPVVCLITTTD